jgi:xanthine/uracil permease
MQADTRVDQKPLLGLLLHVLQHAAFMVQEVVHVPKLIKI